MMKKPDYRTIALKFIRANPEATGFMIWEELRDHSRVTKWFGQNSFLSALFGPTSTMTYDLLDKLETSGLIRSELGLATADGWHRPRCYWIVGYLPKEGVSDANS